MQLAGVQKQRFKKQDANLDNGIRKTHLSIQF